MTGWRQCDGADVCAVRCSRNCYNCPICTAIMAVTAMPQKSSEDAYILQCQYCDWSSLDIGVQLSKPTKVTEQLAKLRKSRVSAEPAAKGAQLSHEDAFANLTAFYKEQLNETGDPQNPYSGSPYSSPANLARIMSLYGGLSVNALKKTREKPQPMREARDEKEGAATYQLADKKAEDDLLRNIRALSWDDTTTSDQRLSAPLNYDARHVDELWPVATPLRTRKGKRCQTCRQILAYPESTKVNNLRYKIRLLAQNHLPRLSLRPLQAAVPPPNPSFRLRADDALQQPDLQPHVTQQYVLTIRNPIFETINVTLATPTVTPGRVASRVTMLCPSFTVGPAGDLWDEALGSSTSSAKGDGGRQAAMASLTGRDEPLDRQPEAGKVWQRTRNSTSVVLEIVPGSLKPAPSIVPTSEQEEELQDGDEVLEVPVYVRAEWEVNADDVDTPAHVLRDSTKEKKTGAGRREGQEGASILVCAGCRTDRWRWMRAVMSN